MAGVHAAGGFVLLAITAAFAVFAIVSTRVARWERTLVVARNVVVALMGAQVLIGGLLWVQGRRPAESLHLLYGAIAFAVLPAAANFAFEAPPKGRAAVMAVAAIVALFLIWRLFATG